MGLANRVVPAAELESYVRDYASTIAGNAPLTIGAVKIAVAELLKPDGEADLSLADAAVDRCFKSSDTSRAVPRSWRSGSRTPRVSKPLQRRQQAAGQKADAAGRGHHDGHRHRASSWLNACTARLATAARPNWVTE